MEKLPDRILCLVTDLERAGGEQSLLKIVDRAVAGGVNVVQVRAHQLQPDARTTLAGRVIATVAKRAIVVVNGPPEVAAAAGADGAHMAESADFPTARFSERLLLGRSVHSVESAERAAADGADYLIAGTVFPSASHPGGATGGITLISEITGAVAIPVIGIGGITVQSAASVIAAGASGVAVIGAIIAAHDPTEAATELSDVIRDATGQSNSR